ncbi:MAG: serine/threonine-protein kinase [Candidatus Sulfotelmatobacter sp.]
MSCPIVNLRPLQAGGNGDLYVGQRSDTGEYVVVKYLREHHLSHARKAFAREIRILGRQLRGLVPLLSSDLASGRPYYVMPYLPGGPLTQYAGRLLDGQLHAVAMEIAMTLATLHAANIAHGDIKPDNILVTHDGHLQVADPLGNGVGCTMLFSQNRGGTPGYWAPEVCAGAPISGPADVYSYGALLYQLLTGRKPNDGQKLDPVSEGYVNAPIVIQVIVACCCNIPAARPTMQEVLRILRGEKWADIQAERKKREEQIAAISVFGALAALVFALAKSGRAVA